MQAIRPLTPGDDSFLFGYYDRCPYDASGRWHLGLRVPQVDHVPCEQERAVLCRIDCAAGTDVAIDELTTTAAWNHQQGSMQHWLVDGSIVVNDRDGERVFSRVIDARGRMLRELPRPVYCLSPDTRWAVSLDFARIPRRGYSYAVSDPSRAGGPRVPEADGVWIMDLQTGAARLLASYRDLLACHPEPANLRLEPYVWLNHAVVNRDGSRLMVLLRYHLEEHWYTFLYTMAADGSGLRCAFPAALWRAGRVTHQAWGRTPDELLVDADFRQVGDGEITVFRDSDRQPVFDLLADGFRGHGHQVFSPCGRYLVSDTYPNEADEQILSLIDCTTGQWQELGRFSHPHRTHSALPHDCRCDLHPRWRPDGRAISIDSIDDGTRRIYEIALV